MRINHNVPAIITQGALAANNRALSKDLEKLSTGLRINRAGDDAAGLAVSEGLRAQIKGVEQAKRNTLDGISALNIAEGAMNEIHTILQRQRELALQSATATYTDTERSYMNQEFKQLSDEIERIMTVTNFNKIKLLDINSEESIFVSRRTFTDSFTGLTAVNDAASALASEWGTASAILGSSDIKVAGAASPASGFTGASASQNDDIAGLDNAFADALAGLVSAMADIDKLAAAASGAGTQAHTKAISAAQEALSRYDEALTALENSNTYANDSDNSDFIDEVDAARALIGTAASRGDFFKALDAFSAAVLNNSSVPTNGDLWVDANEVVGVDSIGVGYDVEMFQHNADISSVESAIEAIKALDAAIKGVSAARADIGAYVNRLEHTVTNLTVASANQQAAESQLRDVDFTYQSSSFTKNQILMQSATAMLSQANASPQSVLSLLR